jgi:hypothetical protein
LGQKAAFQVAESRIPLLALAADYFPEMTGHAVPARGRLAEHAGGFFGGNMQSWYRGHSAAIAVGDFDVSSRDGPRKRSRNCAMC